MIQEEEKRKINSESLEEGLYRKFGELQIAREDKSSTMFDEIAKSIEIRLIAVPNAYYELIKIKESMQAILYEEKNKILHEAENSIDVINRQKYINQENYEVEWEFRDTYEEQIMWIMQKYNLICMVNPKYGILTSFEDIEAGENIEHEQPEKYSKDQNIKPHLSIRK